MAEAGSEESLLLQIEGLVSDALQVVSFKWVSRKFSLSSNASKRLLEKFVKQNDDPELELVYAISGWTKEDPHSYAIQLVPRSKLEEAKDALKAPPSIHIYSVQRCLPKDPAQLWTVDFVETEQLFDESADISNSLRDNRFSAVTFPHVERSLTKKKSGVVPPLQPQPPVAKATAPIPSSTTSGQSAALPPVPAKNSAENIKDASAGKKPAAVAAVAAITAAVPKTVPSECKDSLVPGMGGKRKAPGVGAGNGGSLASMWGKTPAKSKALPPQDSAIVKPPRPLVIAGDAEARILAMEEADGTSGDDMASEFAAMRRGQLNIGVGRRRRMVVDEDSDGDQETTGLCSPASPGEIKSEIVETQETIIRLGSPASPREIKPEVTEASETIVRLDSPASLKEVKTKVSTTRDTLSEKKGKATAQKKQSKVEDEVQVVDPIPVKLEPNLQSNREIKREREEEEKSAPAVRVSDAPSLVSKRKKVLKTRIDERGREVSEVVWENEGEEKENVEKVIALAAKPAGASSKEVVDKAPTERPQAVQKPSTAATKSAAGKAATKASAKSLAKVGKGQGNIMSFFKKT